MEKSRENTLKQLEESSLKLDYQGRKVKVCSFNDVEIAVNDAHNRIERLEKEIKACKIVIRKKGEQKNDVANFSETIDLIKCKIDILKLKADDHTWQVFVDDNTKRNLEEALVKIDEMLSK